MSLSKLSVSESAKECALQVDFTVRSGTVNIFTKQQNFRASWIGESLSTTNVFLKANTGLQSIQGPITTIIVNCEYPVKITYTDYSTGVVTQHVCKQLWISDQYLPQVTLESASENDSAVVVTTIYSEKDDPTINNSESDSSSS